MFETSPLISDERAMVDEFDGVTIQKIWSLFIVERYHRVPAEVNPQTNRLPRFQKVKKAPKVILNWHSTNYER